MHLEIAQRERKTVIDANERGRVLGELLAEQLCLLWHPKTEDGFVANRPWLAVGHPECQRRESAINGRSLEPHAMAAYG